MLASPLNTRMAFASSSTYTKRVSRSMSVTPNPTRCKMLRNEYRNAPAPSSYASTRSPMLSTTCPQYLNWLMIKFSTKALMARSPVLPLKNTSRTKSSTITTAWFSRYVRSTATSNRKKRNFAIAARAAAFSMGRNATSVLACAAKKRCASHNRLPQSNLTAWRLPVTTASPEFQIWRYTPTQTPTPCCTTAFAEQTTSACP